MLVKITDFPDDLAGRLKRVTGQATAAKAVFIAAQRYQVSREYVDILERQLADEREKNKVLRQLIDSARSAAALLLDHTAQEDLL